MGKLIKFVVGLIIVIAILGGGLYILSKRDNTKISTDMLTARLEGASECTTQKLIYRGVVKVSKGFIPIINKNSFLMTYTATVRAGFDISKAKINVTDSIVEVTIPKTTIQEITIDPDSLTFYDTTLTIFKPDGKEQAKEALQKAEADAEEKADSSGLLDAADENAKALITALLVDSAGDRAIIVRHAA